MSDWKSSLSRFDNGKMSKSELSETSYTGIGNPEKLRFDLAGFWSRRYKKRNIGLFS
ncbi:type II toxin-antitoxin system YoeB family toxin [Lacihabitans soyangensis]|uniref:Uncharacterized protein n=1 Tax=Lacihabitans soyangensis TaxID=869394 RepID=A0AAE3H7M0_9BACT|nr:type II toxin-antitoxin system YoeB family toxin [Lacihabitans soyangensis]MCP9764580.1 hypothetical protein [Lacihabitans soyangensis]